MLCVSCGHPHGTLRQWPQGIHRLCLQQPCCCTGCSTGHGGHCRQGKTCSLATVSALHAYETRATNLHSSFPHLQKECYRGPSAKPPVPVCCDNFTEAIQCPNSTVDPTKYGAIIPRAIESSYCAAYGTSTAASTTTTSLSATTKAAHSLASLNTIPNVAIPMIPAILLLAANRRLT